MEGTSRNIRKFSVCQHIPRRVVYLRNDNHCNARMAPSLQGIAQEYFPFVPDRLRLVE